MPELYVILYAEHKVLHIVYCQKLNLKHPATLKLSIYTFHLWIFKTSRLSTVDSMFRFSQKWKTKKNCAEKK